MKHPAEVAAEQMEKEGLAFTTAALIAAGLATVPTVTRGLNWLTGHDAKKKVREAQAAAKAKQMGATPGPSPGMNPMRMPPGAMPMPRMPRMPRILRTPWGPMPRGPMPMGPMPQGMLASAQGLHQFRSRV